jgi:cysteine desulfurase family protein (TIGR01976 family)
LPTGLDIEWCREQFPALKRQHEGHPVAFLDGPAGSQVPRSVADAVARYLIEINANSGGTFVTSEATDDLLKRAHRAVADFLGSDDPELVVFGPNMTTLTQVLARSLARTWKPGDEVVVTRMDHDANFTPWVQAAEDAGATVRTIGFHADDCTLDLDDLRRTVGGSTRLVAVGAASNAVGTVHPIREIAGIVHDAGAQLFVDAVHYAAHRVVDVKAWDCDYVTCSAYKFFGPHIGMLWGKREFLESLPVYKLRPVSDSVPDRWMAGTQSHEGIAGTLAAIDYLATLGRHHRPELGDSSRRQALVSAFETIRTHERELARRLIDGLGQLPGVRVWGINEPDRFEERVSTVSITHERHSPREMATHLGRHGICTWYGNYYALALTEALGLEPEGMLRIGLLHYNTAEEVDRLCSRLTAL